METTDNQSSGDEMDLVPMYELPTMLEPNDLGEQRRWGQRIFSAMRTGQLRVFDRKGAPEPYSDDNVAISYLLVGEVNAWLDRVAPALAFRLPPQECLVPKVLFGKTLRHHRQASQCNRDQERQMSFVLVSELPQMLFDEQHADACNVKYPRPQDVFDLHKWQKLVSTAEQSGDLSTFGGMANIADVNDWLKNGGVGLWSVFELHNPLLPDMDGMFESDYAALPAPIKERISLIFHFSPWDSLSSQERWDKVFEIDALNTPKSRLRLALGNVVFWGEKVGPLQTLSAAVERELQEWKKLPANQPSEKDLRDNRIGEIEQLVNRIESLKDLMLIGCVAETDEFGELVKLLQETVRQPWCGNVRFPVWLDQFNGIEKLSPVSERIPDVALAGEMASASTEPFQQCKPSVPDRQSNFVFDPSVAETENGLRKLILENWSQMFAKHGPTIKAAQIRRFICTINTGEKKQPSLQSVHNRLRDLRKENKLPQKI